MVLRADRDGVAARHRDLLLVVPFEAVARRHGIVGGGQLEALAGDHRDRLVDVVDRPVADHGLRVALQRDMALRLDPVDLGIAGGIGAAAFGLAVMGDQRIGVHLAGAAARDGIAAGDVEMCVLLPLDAGIGLNLQRLVIGPLEPEICAVAAADPAMRRTASKAMST